MKISQIQITASRTLNLGNYESLKMEGQCTVNFDEFDNLDGEEESLKEARNRSITEIKTQMQSAFEQIKPNGK